jgi:hypothetical protein
MRAIPDNTNNLLATTLYELILHDGKGNHDMRPRQHRCTQGSHDRHPVSAVKMPSKEKHTRSINAEHNGRAEFQALHGRHCGRMLFASCAEEGRTNRDVWTGCLTKR